MRSLEFNKIMPILKVIKDVLKETFTSSLLLRIRQMLSAKILYEIH